jgi:hypothetical protein
MSKAMFEEFGYPALSPTMMTIQLADSMIKYPMAQWKMSW